MENVTINGDIIINIGIDAFAGSEDFIEALTDAICEAALKDEDDSEDCTADCSKGSTVIALICPEGLKGVSTYDEYRPMISGMDEACEFSVNGETFNLVFERKGLITVDGMTFLVAPAFVLFHDRTMKPVSADPELLARLENYLDCNRASISFGRADVEVIALEGGICEGV